MHISSKKNTTQYASFIGTKTAFKIDESTELEQKDSVEYYEPDNVA